MPAVDILRPMDPERVEAATGLALSELYLIGMAAAVGYGSQTDCGQTVRT